MDAVSLTIIVRGIGMLGLILGGIAAIYFGYRITGAGSPPGRQSTTTFNVLGLKATAKGAGAVIMMTAGVWGYCGVKIAPNLTTDGHGSKVFSFEVENKRITAPALAATLPDSISAGTKIDAAELTTLFENSLLAQKALSGSKWTTIQGKPATIDPTTISVMMLKDGKLGLATTLKSDDKFAKVTFVPERIGSVLVFTPRAGDNGAQAVFPDTTEKHND
jgi:hypothetical protein